MKLNVKKIIILFIIFGIVIQNTGCVQVVNKKGNEFRSNTAYKSQFLNIKTDEDGKLIDDELNIKFNDNTLARPIHIEEKDMEWVEDRLLIYSGNSLKKVREDQYLFLEWEKDTGKQERHVFMVMMLKNDKVYMRKARIEEMLSQETLDDMKITIKATTSIVRRRRNTTTQTLKIISKKEPEKPIIFGITQEKEILNRMQRKSLGTAGMQILYYGVFSANVEIKDVTSGKMGWINSDGNYRYRYREGLNDFYYVKDGFAIIKNNEGTAYNCYYFDSNGYLKGETRVYDFIYAQIKMKKTTTIGEDDRSKGYGKETGTLYYKVWGSDEEKLFEEKDPIQADILFKNICMNGIDNKNKYIPEVEEEQEKINIIKGENVR